MRDSLPKKITFWKRFTSLYMTEPGKMGPNSPFMEIELAIVHESLRNAEKDATNRMLIS